MSAPRQFYSRRAPRWRARLDTGGTRTDAGRTDEEEQMRRFPTFVSIVSMAFVALLAGAPPAAAADSPIGGTYVAKAKDGKPEMTMKIDAWGPGKVKLTYHVKGVDNMVLTVVSDLKGKEATVSLNGKPTGETMAITVVDSRHSSTVLKMNGKPMGSSKAEFSADYKTLTVQNDMTAMVGNVPQGKSTEVWVRQ
jgi:hypothetical protein